MRPELLLPLSDLPGPVPEGAPIWHPKYGSGILLDGSDPHTPAIFRLTRGTAWSPQFLEGGLSELYLDLSAPPTHDRWPTRVDGLTVGAEMLARAMGLDPSGGVIFRRASDSRRSDPSRILWLLSTCFGNVEFSAENIPALACIDIDLTDPAADRLALVAVIRSKPWESR